MIVRSNEHRQYVLIRHAVIRYGGLTLPELGLYMVMMIRPDHWAFHEKTLAKERNLDPEEIRRLLKGLESKGFTQERVGPYGRYWDLYELPGHVAEAARNAAKENDEGPKEKASVPEPPAATEPSAATEPAEQDFTNEEMARFFYDQAAELRKIGQQRKAEQEAERRKRLSGV